MRTRLSACGRKTSSGMGALPETSSNFGTLVPYKIKRELFVNDYLKALSDTIDAYWDKIAKPLFNEENNLAKEFITNQEKNKLQPFLKYTPFPSKKRTFTYTTEFANTDNQKTLIKGLGATENQNTNNKTWNDELAQDVYISKAKFN